jgi:hypothetical protein
MVKNRIDFHRLEHTKLESWKKINFEFGIKLDVKAALMVKEDVQDYCSRMIIYRL